MHNSMIQNIIKHMHSDLKIIKITYVYFLIYMCIYEHILIYIAICAYYLVKEKINF